MPRPAVSGERYVAALDGLRAVAVASVVAYHLNLSWAQGGMLGVGVFFTLSGYLITDLLLDHWRRHGELGLGRFWLRRARRLLPALFVMLAVVAVLVAVLDASHLAAIRRQLGAAALYVSNWQTIADHGSYFSRFAAPLPLDHLWSLAIEEQFYLVWPWLVLAGIWTMRSRGRLALATLAGAAASAVAMALLYHPGYDPTRVYEGTDTRAFELLLGAALAVVWPARRAAAGARGLPTPALDAAGVAGLAGIAVLVWRTGSFSGFLYPTGFLLLSLATVAVMAAVVRPSSRLGAALGCAPLRWVGVRSYGIYLWHWPIIVLLAPATARLDAPRAVLAIAITLVVSAVSWRWIEDPIRHGALGRLWRQLRSGARPWAARRRALGLSGGTAVAVALAAASMDGLVPAASAGGGRPALLRLPDPAQRARLATAGPTPAHATAVSHRTSCRSVVYIGDSTSEGEVSSDYLPDPRWRLPSRLAAVGVRETIPEISGARSIVETYQGHPNAATVARAHVAEGFHGCWILALGTNDVDNVHDGSPTGYRERIDRMMSIIGRRPVLWVDVITLLPMPAPYAEQAMQRWNRALLAACRRYPTMRVYDWASHARQRWFIPDGIHYTTPGYRHRTRLIAEGLAHAFPERGPPPRACLVE